MDGVKCHAEEIQAGSDHLETRLRSLSISKT